MQTQNFPICMWVPGLNPSYPVRYFILLPASSLGYYFFICMCWSMLSWRFENSPYISRMLSPWSTLLRILCPVNSILCILLEPPALFSQQRESVSSDWDFRLYSMACIPSVGSKLGAVMRFTSIAFFLKNHYPFLLNGPYMKTFF